MKREGREREGEEGGRVKRGRRMKRERRRVKREGG